MDRVGEERENKRMERTGNRGKWIESERRENKRMERMGKRGRQIESERRERTREWRERGTGEGG